MSEENVEIVHKALDVYNAFMRGELSVEAAVEAAAPVTHQQVELIWHSERGDA